METKMMISAVISGAVLIVGALEMIYQIYHITVIDATARGLKHPKTWKPMCLYQECICWRPMDTPIGKS